MKLDLSGVDDIVIDEKPRKLDISGVDDINLDKQETKEPSKLEALVRSLAQGASLNTIDELTGALNTPIGAAKATANIFGADFADEDVARYEKERDLSRQAYKAAEEAHPATYIAGEIAGSMVVPGLGWGKGGIAGAKGLAKFGARALEGAALGGATALGSTEETGTEALGQAGKGAVFGGTIAPVAGAAIDAVVPTAKWLVGKIGDNEAIANAYQKAKMGESLSTPKAIEETNKKLLDFIRDELAPAVDTKTKSVINAAYNEALDDVRKSGKAIRIEDLLSSVEKMAKKNKLGAEDTKKVSELIERFGEKQSVPTRTIMKKPNFINPEEAHLAEQATKGDKFIQDQVDALKRTQDVKEARSMLKRAGEPSIGGNETPNIYEGIGPAFDSDLLAAKSQSASPTLKALKPFEAKPYTPKGETSRIDYQFEDIFTKPNLGIDDLIDLKRRLEILAKSPDPAAADAAAKMAELVKEKSRELAGTDNYKMADEFRKLQSLIEAKFSDIPDSAILREDHQLLDRTAKKISRGALSRGTNKPQDAILLDEGFDAMAKVLPEEASKLKKQLTEKALDVETAEVLAGKVNPSTPWAKGTLGPTITSGADIAGRARHSIGKITAPVADFSKEGIKKMHEWSDDHINEAVMRLASKGFTSFAETLKKARLGSAEKRRALIFSLTQQPDFRNAFSDEDQK